jgi:NAD(P) transhydrogenase subunit alpha
MIDFALLAADPAPAMEAASQAAAHAPADFMGMLFVLALAVFLGFELISKVPQTLHTPLMSGSNAISGITIIGAIACAGRGNISFAGFFGMIALILATVNCVGGFMVTDRMLKMFGGKR